VSLPPSPIVAFLGDNKNFFGANAPTPPKKNPTCTKSPPMIETLCSDQSLWNRYDISRKSPEVPVKRSPKVVRKERALALNAPWDSTAIGCKNIRAGDARIFRLFTTGSEVCCGAGRPSRRRQFWFDAAMFHLSIKGYCETRLHRSYCFLSMFKLHCKRHYRNLATSM